MKTVLIFLFLTCISGCVNRRKSAAEREPNFNAIVGNRSIDCGDSWMLTLFIDGKPVIQPVYEINLPDSLRIEGLKLFIDYRKPEQEEMMKCHALGPGYNQVYIIHAKSAKLRN